jgi:hypothetical protein
VRAAGCRRSSRAKAGVFGSIHLELRRGEARIQSPSTR